MIKAINILPSRMQALEIPEELAFLPDDYKLYLRNFEQSKEELPLLVRKVLIESDNYKYQIGWTKSEQCKLLEKNDRLVGMESVHELCEQLTQESNWSKDGFLFIGSTLANHILLKVKDDNDSGKIYFQHRDRMDYELVAADIFDFFAKMELVPDKQTLEDLEVKSNALYKNWDEDFWRVRKD